MSFRQSRTLSEENLQRKTDEESHCSGDPSFVTARRIPSAFSSFSLASRMTKTSNYAELLFLKIDICKISRDSNLYQIQL